MLGIHGLWLFILSGILLNITPGPDTAYIVGRVEAGEFGLAIAYSSVLIVVMALGISLIQLGVGERKLGRRSTTPALASSAAEPIK